MGLSLVAGKYENGEKMHFSYGGFTDFRAEIIGSMYGKKYHDFLLRDYRWSYIPDKYKKLNWFEKLLFKFRVDKDLYCLIYHSDCDGKLTWQECRTLYNKLKDVYWYYAHNIERFDRFRDLLKICIKKRVTLWFV